MTDEERYKKIDTMKALIKAECARLIEQLDGEEDVLSYASGVKAKLRTRMLELRKDTMRLEHLMYYHDYFVED